MFYTPMMEMCLTSFFMELSFSLYYRPLARNCGYTRVLNSIFSYTSQLRSSCSSHFLVVIFLFQADVFMEARKMYIFWYYVLHLIRESATNQENPLQVLNLVRHVYNKVQCLTLHLLNKKGMLHSIVENHIF